jgi:5-methylcytosine-specific restriction enzyme A
MNFQKRGERGTPRPSAAKRGYGGRWQRMRAIWLKGHPLCSMCLAQGRTTAATVVDHIQRHHGPADPLFWDRTNWQSLCYRCHDSIKQALDRHGKARGWDVHGMPLRYSEHYASSKK